MYFQGMEEGNLDYFKFFRKLSSDETPTPETIERKRAIDAQKGYDTDYKTCMKDSTIGNIKCKGAVKEKMKKGKIPTKNRPKRNPKNT